MKKMFILASLALVGMACSKNDDNVGVYNGGGNKVISNSTISGDPFITEEPAVFPTQKEGNDQEYDLTTYTLENNKVKSVVIDNYVNGQKVNNETITTNVTYNAKGLPSKLEQTQDTETRTIEYIYNAKNQIEEIKATHNNTTTKYIHEYDAQGRLSKMTFSATNEQPYTITYEYPTANTVVEKNSTNTNESLTYTFENGNLTKKVLERFYQGKVIGSAVEEYKYDTTIKNPDASLELKLVDLNYYLEEDRYSPERSKNVVTEITKSGTDDQYELPKRISATYTYEKNDKGYPTKKTETKAGNTPKVTTYTY